MHTPQQGPYELLHQLGEGGMGTVWLARHHRSNQLVALKILTDNDARIKSRFRNEIKTLQNIPHPGVVRFIEAGTSQNTLWYAMELIEGKPLSWHLKKLAKRWPTPHLQAHMSTLDKRSSSHWTSHLSQLDKLISQPHNTPPTIPVQRPSTLTPRLKNARSVQALREALATTLTSSPDAHDPSPNHNLLDEEHNLPPRTWPDDDLITLLGNIAQLCTTLAHIHGEGIVHCDLKPENIVINKDGDAILVDFGIADKFGARVEHEVLEGAGIQAGTAYYISPEQIRGEPVDARTDLYAIGCILHEILTGAPPFSQGTPMAILLKHLSTPPTPLSTLNPQLPSDISTLCQTLLQKEPVHRIGNAMGIVNTLAVHVPHIRTFATSLPKPKPYLYRAKLTGRDELMHSLETYIHEVKVGELHAISLGGESGVGKSSVAAELIGRARNHDLFVLSSYCKPLDQLSNQAIPSPLHAFEPIFRQVVDYALEHLDSSTFIQLINSIHLLRPYSHALKEIPLHDIAITPRRHSPEHTKALIFSSLYTILDSYLAHKPTLILFDDANHIDALSWIIKRAQSKDKRWLITLMYATDEPSPNLEQAIQHKTWKNQRIQKLAPHVVASLCAQMLGAPSPDPRLITHVQQQTHGNPFFVAEYLKLAMEHDLLHMDAQGQWHLQPDLSLNSLDTPNSVQAIIQSRLRNLPPDNLAMCEVASVFGMRFTLKDIQAITGKKRKQLNQITRDLKHREILQNTFSEMEMFSHSRLHESIYEHIPQQQKQHLHLQVAQLLTSQNLPPEQRAHHLEHAGNPLEAAQLYSQAAQNSFQQHAYEQAIELHLRALSLQPELQEDSLEQRLTLVQNLLLPTRQLTLAEEHLEIILKGARQLDILSLRSRALVLLAQTCTLQGNFARAERLLDEAAQRFESLASGLGKADTLYELAKLKVTQLDFDNARQLADQARQTFLRVKHKQGQAKATLLLGEICWRLERTREATSTFEQSLSLHQKLAHPSGIAESLIWLAQIYCALEQPKKSLTHLQQARPLLKKLNDPSGQAQCLIISARLARQRDDIHTAIQHFEQAITHLQLTHDPHHLLIAIKELSHLYELDGQHHKITHLSEQAKLLSESPLTHSTLSSIESSQTAQNEHD